MNHKKLLHCKLNPIGILYTYYNNIKHFYGIPVMNHFLDMSVEQEEKMV